MVPRLHPTLQGCAIRARPSRQCSAQVTRPLASSVEQRWARSCHGLGQPSARLTWWGAGRGPASGRRCADRCSVSAADVGKHRRFNVGLRAPAPTRPGPARPRAPSAPPRLRRATRRQPRGSITSLITAEPPAKSTGPGPSAAPGHERPWAPSLLCELQVNEFGPETCSELPAPSVV